MTVYEREKSMENKHTVKRSRYFFRNEKFTSIDECERKKSSQH